MTCMPSDLEDVVPRPDVRDVDPLTVDVVAVRVPAARCHTLVTHIIAGIAFLQSCTSNRHSFFRITRVAVYRTCKEAIINDD